jgi:uncharacterized membrane protein YfhO
MPGWTATVNRTPVLVGVFEGALLSVEVPAGESLVDFRYAPRTLGAGAALSLATCIALSAMGILRRCRRQSGKGLDEAR